MKYATPQGCTVPAVYDAMMNQPHLLVAGATGSGKSVFINALITTAITRSPASVQFVLLDPKTTELWQWARLPHVISYDFEQENMIEALQNTVETMAARLAHMHNVGERIWPGSQIYVVIDELADLLTTNKTAVVPLLQRICQLGRAAGIHCIAATQCLLASVLPTQIKVNFSSVVCLRTATKQQSRYIVDAPGAELFPNPREAGKAFAFYRNGADLKRFEVYRYPEEETARLVDWWLSPDSVIG